MSTIASTTGTTNSSQSASTTAPNAYTSLQPSDFIQLMITQLQNQDPTQPTSNEEILQQVSQIGQLQSSDTLQTDLQAMTLQNSISSAGNLIGKSVVGVDSTGAKSSGLVNSVQVQNGDVYLQLDSGKQMLLSNVQSISAPPTATASAGSNASGTAAAAA